MLPTHQAVLDKLATTTLKGEILDGILKKAAGHNFYNTSRFTFDTLLDDADHIRENLIDYLDGFSEDVKDIIKNYKFTEQIDRMTDPDHNILFGVLNRFKAINLGLYDKKTNPNGIDNIDMGYIFEEIIRRFSSMKSIIPRMGLSLTQAGSVNFQKGIIKHGYILIKPFLIPEQIFR